MEKAEEKVIYKAWICAKCKRINGGRKTTCTKCGEKCGTTTE